MNISNYIFLPCLAVLSGCAASTPAGPGSAPPLVNAASPASAALGADPTTAYSRAQASAARPGVSLGRPREEIPRAGPQLTVRAVGDVNLGRGWPADQATLPPNDARELFVPFGDALRKADITFGNLETVLADTGSSAKCGAQSTRCYSFRAPTAYAKTLKEAGFDVMSVANNHAGDFGAAGRLTTKQTLDGVGIKHSGTVGDIATMTVNGLKVGLIAFAPGPEVYSLLDIAAAQKVVAQTKRSHDLVIVSFHGGAEGSDKGRVPRAAELFLGENRGNIYAFGHAVVDAGADLVIGHGPHRLRGMEIYNGRLIAYSLGNFSAYHTLSLSPPLGITGILEVTLAPNGVATKVELIPGIMEDPGIPRPDPARRAIDIVRQASKQDFGSELIGPDGRWVRQTPTTALR